MQAGGRENRPGSRPGSAGTGGAPPAGVRRAKDGGAVIPSRSAMQMLPSEGLPLAIGSAMLDAKRLSSRSSKGGHIDASGSATARPASRGRTPTAPRPLSAGNLSLPRIKAGFSAPSFAACPVPMQDLGNKASTSTMSRVKRQQQQLKDASVPSSSSSSSSSSSRPAASRADPEGEQDTAGRCSTAPAPCAGRPSSNRRQAPLSGRASRVAHFSSEAHARDANQDSPFFLTGLGIEDAPRSSLPSSNASANTTPTAGPGDGQSLDSQSLDSQHVSSSPVQDEGNGGGEQPRPAQVEGAAADAAASESGVGPDSAKASGSLPGGVSLMFQEISWEDCDIENGPNILDVEDESEDENEGEENEEGEESDGASRVRSVGHDGGGGDAIRQELNDYLGDLAVRVDGDGEKLVDFPDDYEQLLKVAEAEAVGTGVRIEDFFRELPSLAKTEEEWMNGAEGEEESEEDRLARERHEHGMANIRRLDMMLAEKSRRSRSVRQQSEGTASEARVMNATGIHGDYKLEPGSAWKEARRGRDTLVEGKEEEEEDGDGEGGPEGGRVSRARLKTAMSSKSKSRSRGAASIVERNVLAAKAGGGLLLSKEQDMHVEELLRDERFGASQVVVNEGEGFLACESDCSRMAEIEGRLHSLVSVEIWETYLAPPTDRSGTETGTCSASSQRAAGVTAQDDFLRVQREARRDREMLHDIELRMKRLYDPAQAGKLAPRSKIDELIFDLEREQALSSCGAGEGGGQGGSRGGGNEGGGGSLAELLRQLEVQRGISLDGDGENGVGARRGQGKEEEEEEEEKEEKGMEDDEGSADGKAGGGGAVHGDDGLAREMRNVQSKSQVHAECEGGKGSSPGGLASCSVRGELATSLPHPYPSVTGGARMLVGDEADAAAKKGRLVISSSSLSPSASTAAAVPPASSLSSLPLSSSVAGASTATSARGKSYGGWTSSSSSQAARPRSGNSSITESVPVR